jgi:tRNA-modifying protein YgfZ
MPNEPLLVPLDDLGMIRVHGADTIAFLQGQLSNDLTRLAPEHALLAGYHNPQGRTIAVVRLLWLGEQDVIAVLPRELASTVATRLAKFVLRAKVKIADESTAWRAFGVIGSETAADALAAMGAPAATPHAGVGKRRTLIVLPAESPAGAVLKGDHREWHRLEIAAAQPQVFAATSEEFVAQMLNLDALDAVSFEKGCYTGQEVIARAHYRGRVKRRLQRFLTRAPQTLAPGDTGRLADGRAFKVVDAVQLEDGRCEFLAVADTGRAESPPAPSATATLEADSLPLPYVLPE